MRSLRSRDGFQMAVVGERCKDRNLEKVCLVMREYSDNSSIVPSVSAQQRISRSFVKISLVAVREMTVTFQEGRAEDVEPLVTSLDPISGAVRHKQHCQPGILPVSLSNFCDRSLRVLSKLQSLSTVADFDSNSRASRTVAQASLSMDCVVNTCQKWWMCMLVEVC